MFFRYLSSCPKTIIPDPFFPEKNPGLFQARYRAAACGTGTFATALQRLEGLGTEISFNKPAGDGGCLTVFFGVGEKVVVNPWQAEGERADEEVWELGMQESLGNVDIDGRNLKQLPRTAKSSIKSWSYYQPQLVSRISCINSRTQTHPQDTK